MTPARACGQPDALAGRNAQRGVAIDQIHTKVEVFSAQFLHR